jgi:hypothetical protein
VSVETIKVTAAGMPGVEVGGVRYPLAFTVLGTKRWAEALGIDYANTVAGTWNVSPGLSDVQLASFLRIALEDGEKRRHLCEEGERREITDELISHIFGLFSRAEVDAVLSAAWAPEPPDPQPAPRSA